MIALENIKGQCPEGYIINEIIPFNYPFREIQVKAIVNKNPDMIMQEIYSILLKTISAGYSSEDKIIQFLGLEQDDFILKELYFLHDNNFLFLNNDEWEITNEGKKFIKDNSILKIQEEENITFLLDCISDNISHKRNTKSTAKLKELESKTNYKPKDLKILKDKRELIIDLYNSITDNELTIINIDERNILKDTTKYHSFYFIEYIPKKSRIDELDPFIEVRDFYDLTKDKQITKTLEKYYPDIIYTLTDSERGIVGQQTTEEREKFIRQADFQKNLTSEVLRNSGKLSNKDKPILEDLTIYETQEQFVEILKTAKKKILIESPWVKHVTMSYLSLFENALRRGVRIIILYGYDGDKNHNHNALEKLKELEKKYPIGFSAIYLPTHLKGFKHNSFSGTHRKTTIKDNEFYLDGSFNFLSFKFREDEKVSNEQSKLIRYDVKGKWKKIFSEYSLEHLSSRFIKY